MVENENNVQELLQEKSHCDFECPNVNYRVCKKCDRRFCPRHASRVHPQFCQDCMKDVTLLIDKYVKTEEDFDLYSNQMVRHRSSCTRYQMNGPDYIFYSEAIKLLSDDELKTQYEFMNFLRSLIEAEQTTRKVRKLDELRNSPTPKVMSVKTTTTVKKTREAKSVNYFQQFLKLGIPKDTARTMAQQAGQVITDEEFNKV